MDTMPQLHDAASSLLRRRVRGVLRDLSDLAGIKLSVENDSALVAGLRELKDRLVPALLRDEQALAEMVIGVRDRFERVWPSSDDEAAAMLAQARSELIEIEKAIADQRTYGGQGHDAMLRVDVIEEIGDAMLALGRLALAVGCTSALEPLGVSLRKTFARLRHMEMLVASDREAPRCELWKMAKLLAEAERSTP